MEKTHSASCYDKTEFMWLLNGRCIDFKWFWRMNWTGYSNDSAYIDFTCDWNGHCVFAQKWWTLTQWWMGCMAQREESGASRWSVEVVLKSSDVYSWERDEVSTSSDCDVIIVAECTWKIHIGEIGHVLSSFIVNENYSQEWCDEDSRMCNYH